MTNEKTTDSAASALSAGLGAWLPIEPPPKDGRYLVCAETDDGPYVCEMQRLNDNWLYEGEPTYCHPFWISPTHWMLLPIAPGATTNDGAESHDCKPSMDALMHTFFDAPNV